MSGIFDRCFRKLKEKVPALYANSIVESLFRFIETCTGVESAVIALGVFGVLGVYLVVGGSNDFVCNTIGLIYPAYASLMALKSPGAFDERKLLRYWTIYSPLMSIEYVFHCACDHLRVYWLGKCIFLIWLLRVGLPSKDVDVECSLIDLNLINLELQEREASENERSLVRKRTANGDVKRTQKSLPPRSTDVLTCERQWLRDAVTVAGGYGNGTDLNQLYAPSGIFVDDDGHIYVADFMNNRIIESTGEASECVVAAGGEHPSTETLFLNPTDVILDKNTDSFIICDGAQKQLVRVRRGTREVEVIAENIGSRSVTVDETGSVYATDYEKCAVVRYDIGDREGTIVAGGNGQGTGLDQLSSPFGVFVDQEYSIYVSDEDNHRVMKWTDGASEGVIVAGGHGDGDGLSQFRYPRGIVVDASGTLYVNDFGNGRVVRWPKDATEGEVVAGGAVDGEEANRLQCVNGLSFDRLGNLYVVDSGHSRVLKFSIA